MMRYVHDNHLNWYDWFLRLDDDAYVNIEKITSILRKIDSNRPIYMGSPGFGRDSDDFIEGCIICMTHNV